MYINKLLTLQIIFLSRISILLFISLTYYSAHSQVAINITGAAPHESAILDISSINKALIIPRMMFSQMSMIPSPVEGMLVFVTDAPSGTYQYKSGSWERLISRSPSIVNGGVFFGFNHSIHQNATQFWWDNTNNRLGLGTNTPMSSLSIANTNFPASWIAADFGNPSGSRLVLGNLSGNPTIGATVSSLTMWDTLAINPGGNVSLPYYAASSTKLLSLKSNGIVSTQTAENGIIMQNDSVQLGGSLIKDTYLHLNQKNLNIQGGTSGSVLTINSNSSGVIFNTTLNFGQSFVTQTNGTLNQISILMGHDLAGFLGYYELHLGQGYGGPIVATANVFIPPFNANTYVDIPLNVPVTSGQTYTIRVHSIGGRVIKHVTDSDNIAGNLFSDLSIILPADQAIKVYETEPLYNLLQVNSFNRLVSIDGPTSSFKITSMSGTGTRSVIVSPDGTLSANTGPLASVSAVTGIAPIQVIDNTTTPVISMPQATSTVAGYLAPGDYNVFNNKQNALPNASAIASGILTSTDWTTFNNKQSVTNFASASSNGVLSSTDWNIFNNKQNASSFASTSTNGVLSSSDWNTFNNKQNTNSFAGATTNGVLSSTDWNIFNNKQSTTQFAGTNTHGILSSADWNTFNIKYNLPSLTSGSVLFSDGATIAQKNSHLFWDNTNNALGIGTNTPSAGLNIHGYGWNNGLRVSKSATGGVGPAIFLDGDLDFAIISTSSGAGAGANKLNIYDATNDQSRLVIDQNGTVGIGENMPTSKLQVNGTSGLKVSSNHTGSGYADWISGNFGGQGGKRVVLGVFDTIATIGAHNNTLDQWRNIAINPSTSGNVGIGTTNPQYKLDINGNQRVTGNILASGHVRQFVHQENITIPGALYPVINPLLGGPTTPTYGETTAIWVHNLGYNPILMTSLQMLSGMDVMHHVNVSYRHADVNTVEFFFRNTSVNQATGTLNVIVAN